MLIWALDPQLVAGDFSEFCYHVRPILPGRSRHRSSSADDIADVAAGRCAAILVPDCLPTSTYAEVLGAREVVRDAGAIEDP